MAVGRRPKPDEVKRLTGNPGKRPLNGSAPKPAVGLPIMPRGRLGHEGQRLWRELGPMLEKYGLITDVDGPSFEMLCAAYEMAVLAARQVREEGLTIGVGDKMRTNPVVKIQESSSKLYRQYAEQFGLTPSARSRIHVEGTDQERSLVDLLFGEVEVRDETG